MTSVINKSYCSNFKLCCSWARCTFTKPCSNSQLDSLTFVDYLRYDVLRICSIQPYFYVHIYKNNSKPVWQRGGLPISRTYYIYVCIYLEYTRVDVCVCVCVFVCRLVRAHIFPCSFYYVHRCLISLHSLVSLFADVWCLQVEGLWEPGVQQVWRHHLFSSVCSLHVSVSHAANSHISALSLLSLLRRVMSDRWRYHYNWLRAPGLCPCTTANLVCLCCACSDCSTDWLFPASSSPQPPCSRSHNSIEIRPVNNLTMASEISS